MVGDTKSEMGLGPFVIGVLPDMRLSVIHRTIFLLLCCSLLFTSAPAAAVEPAYGTGKKADEKLDLLTSGQWRWTDAISSQNAIKVEKPADYVLEFQTDGSLRIKADCNRVIGKYSVNGTALEITLGPSTLANCVGNSRSDEFLALLTRIRSFNIAVAGRMTVVLKDDSVMIFAVPRPIDLCGEPAFRPRTLADTVSPSISKKLDERLQLFVRSISSPAPGTAMLVITPKGKYLKSVGVSNVQACKELSANSPFQIGSNTKMMTAAMIYQLQEEGRLSTSDKATKWLPKLVDKFPNLDKITIEMLLTHTSGIKDYFDNDTGSGAIKDGVKNRTILVRGYKPLELIMSADPKPLFEPAESGKWSYSNTGYIMLGLIIEKVTGSSYEQNLVKRIIRPLRLKKTYLQIGQPKAGSLPQAYYGLPFTFATGEWNASQGWAAGAVVSTPDEFATFLKALFTGKLFKNSETLAAMETCPSAGKNVLGPGSQYCHGSVNINGAWGHGGQTLGFGSIGGYLPESDTTFVVWTNAGASTANSLAVPSILEIIK